MAHAILKELKNSRTGDAVECGQVLAVLRLWAFKKNRDRLNVLPVGDEWVLSETIGLTRSRTGNWQVAKRTTESPNMTRLLLRWAGEQWRQKFTGQWVCTSICLNCGYAARSHRDQGNVGPSLVRALGQFQGGSLRVWGRDDGTAPPDELPLKDAKTLNIGKGFALING